MLRNEKKIADEARKKNNLHNWDATKEFDFI